MEKTTKCFFLFCFIFYIYIYSAIILLRILTCYQKKKKKYKKKKKNNVKKTLTNQLFYILNKKRNATLSLTSDSGLTIGYIFTLFSPHESLISQWFWQDLSFIFNSKRHQKVGVHNTVPRRNSVQIFMQYFSCSAVSVIKHSPKLKVDFECFHLKVQICHKSQQDFESQKRWRQFLYFLCLLYNV